MTPTQAVTGFLDGSLYRDMRAMQTRLMEQSAAIAGARVAAQARGDTAAARKADEAFRFSQQARDEFNSAKSKYNFVAGEIKKACAAYGGCTGSPMLAGLGALGVPQAVIVAIVAAITVTGAAAVAVLVYKGLDTTVAVANKADAILDSMANIIREGGGFVEKSASSFVNVAIIAGVGFGAFVLWDAWKSGKLGRRARA